jgi:hypothetical protein
MSRPFLWVWAGATIISFVLLVRIRTTRVRAMVLVVFGFACALFLGEMFAVVYKGRRPAGRLVSHYSPLTLTRTDPELGYVLNPGARIAASRQWSDSTLFAVTYNITESGVRYTRGDPAGDTWLFVGCSFTFGEGVEDHETLPARFSEQLDWQANVVNVSATGWGPHHVLRALETGRLGGVHPPVKHVIYQALPSHVGRAAGRAKWDLDGPSYRISGDTVRFDGPFHGKRFVRAHRLARKSDLVARLMDRLYHNREPGEREIELYGRIVERIASLAKRNLGAPTTVLFWDDDSSETSRRILERLTTTGVPIIRASSFLTQRELDSLRIPHDNHPMPVAYTKLAAGLAAHFGAVKAGSVIEATDR